MKHIVNLFDKVIVKNTPITQFLHNLRYFRTSKKEEQKEKAARKKSGKLSQTKYRSKVISRYIRS
ncbi:MAG TPA: hypothetical protein DDY77_01925 [Clostridiales bacterium]|nr:hypothetical protein [Clostridiales bacterium]